MTHEELLASDLPKRLEAARKLPRHDAAMTMPIDNVPVAPIVIAVIGLGACAVFPWVCLAAASHPPAWVVLFMGALSLLPLAILRSAWRRWSDASRGFIQRELYAVVDRDDLRIAYTTNYFVTLWNPQTPPRKVQMITGAPLVEIGDTCVAIFRGEQLINVIRL